MKYAVVCEKAPHNYAAYVADLPGCVATGATLEDARRNIREAIAFHLEGLCLEQQPIPEPRTWSELVEA